MDRLAARAGWGNELNLNGSQTHAGALSHERFCQSFDHPEPIESGIYTHLQPGSRSGFGGTPHRVSPGYVRTPAFRGAIAEEAAGRPRAATVLRIDGGVLPRGPGRDSRFSV